MTIQEIVQLIAVCTIAVMALLTFLRRYGWFNKLLFWLSICIVSAGVGVLLAVLPDEWSGLFFDLLPFLYILLVLFILYRLLKLMGQMIDIDRRNLALIQEIVVVLDILANYIPDGEAKKRVRAIIEGDKHSQDHTE